MRRAWPSVRLGELLRAVSRPESVKPERTYRILGARWYAEGLYTKDIKQGTAIQARTLYRICAGDFVYNRLFAWKGSFAVASEENDNCYVSNEFLAYSPDPDRLDGHYLWRYFSLPPTWGKVLGLSSGSTPASRNRLKEEQFLSMAVPLPPLGEQRRIVARIDGLTSRVEEVHGLQAEQEDQERKLLLRSYHEVVAGASWLPLEKVAPLVRRPVRVAPHEQYREIGIKSFGKGTFHKPPVSGTTLGNKRIFSIEPGDLLFNIVFAWEGAVAVAQEQDAGRVGSHRFLTCVPTTGVATAEFLRFHFLTPRGIHDLDVASPGGAGRNRTLGLRALADIHVPVPSIEKQLRFNRLQAKVSALNAVREESRTEWNSLLPSLVACALAGRL